MEPLRILVVDDEVELVDALVERLNLRGFDAHGETHGREALDRLIATPFDVVLLDVRMPGVGGLDVIEVIKSRLPHVQVVMLTGHGSVEDAEKGRRLGAFEYLMKPVKIEKLVEILNAAAGRLQDQEE